MANGGDNETIKRSHLFKKPNVPIEYLIFLRSVKRWLSLDSFGYGWDFQLETLLKRQNKTFVRPMQVFTIVDSSYIQQSMLYKYSAWALVRSAGLMSSLNTI